LYPTEFVDSYTGQVVWQDRVRVRNDLANCLDKMVAYHPDERYNSASEALYLIKELTQTVYNKPVSSPLPPPLIQLPTPPVQPISAIKYAGFGRRIAADFIDRSILIVASLAWDFANFGLPNSENEGEFWGRIIVLYIILAFVYCPTMESFKTQATLGKIALG
jgi:serine/threonine-protein kinase